jgi:diguanylate cyclase (GGDEF)-like protein/PAS domain S-box-containing protein
MILALYILSSLRKADKERKARKNLIDQNIMISTLDKEGKVMDASNALCRFLGVNKKDLIGETSYYFDNSEKREQLVNDISTRIHTGSEWRGEIQYLDKQGRLHWAQSTIVPNFDDNYKITKFTNILISITNKKLSSIDTLTSLLNRRSFDEILLRELLLARHNAKFITLAVLDIDHFKKYNDCYGHPQGDDALKRVSQVLLSVMQDKHSYAFRIGGEEFAILLVGDDESVSKNRLQKVKDHIEALHIMHEESPTGPYLTISIGAHVLLPTSNVEEDILYITADKALYQAKKTRNTLEITSEFL